MSCENCERLKDTNARLHRRCQSAEAGLAAKLGEHSDGSLGRTLANAAATMYREQAEEAGREIARLKAEVAGTADAASIITRRQDEKIKSLQAEVERVTDERDFLKRRNAAHKESMKWYAELHAKHCGLECCSEMEASAELNALTDATKKGETNA